ncbi:hypothetical protein PL263_18910 [Methylomonas sp. EFPC3]|uniref:hypothetical protein n=1 Tax=Methylomonas sp. EFPC3 TaxID=3021710 RepID=UPI002417395D|nr:hypothetical protein [Methylomonas sp. EFPC3]WFP50151.1 hypothetical protein PL263_18910 [Methylomonas sp. EFPC3]
MKSPALLTAIAVIMTGCAAIETPAPAETLAPIPDFKPAPPQTKTQPAEKTGPVDVYLLPLDDFSADYAAQMAKTLTKEFGIRVKATLPLGSLRLHAFPGTQQYAAQDIFEQAGTVMRRLPEGGKHTHFVFLTNRDINARDRNFRFQFSFHDRDCRCSVVSAARMHQPGDTATSPAVETRFLKMTKRAIGEMDLGWTRSTDIKDLMYSPIMSLDDLDALGNRHPPIRSR